MFGRTGSAAELEGSKAFTKHFLARRRSRRRNTRTFTQVGRRWRICVRKARQSSLSGRSGGRERRYRGDDAGRSEAAVHLICWRATLFCDGGHRIVIEEFLDCEEASFIVMVDGEHVLPMATSQDYKRVGDKDTGPNTAGWRSLPRAP
ncbi:hypothetical protein ACNKHU_25325 [Shigella flexneri]